MGKNLVLFLVSILALAAFGSGCDSPISDVKDMKNTTAQMANTTGDLDQKTDAVVNKTSQLLDLTGILKSTISSTYYGLREGNAAITRTDMLKKMNQATNQQTKIILAAIYFQSFEYQLWTGQQTDTEGALDNLYFEAVQEFEGEVSDYLPSDLTNIKPTSTNNQMMNLYALSVAMHLNNELEINQPVLQNDDPSRTGPYKVSMFDLLKSSLRASSEVRKGLMASNQETDWQQAGAQQEQLLQSLIQTRENFMSAMTLAEVSNIVDSGFLGIPGLAREGLMYFFPWSSKISKLNIDQLNEYDSWVVESNSDRDFLATVGADASIDSSIIKIYKNMKQPAMAADVSTLSLSGKTAAQNLTQAGQKLWNDIQDMIQAQAKE